MAAKPLLLAGTGVLVLGWILHIVGTATPGWSIVAGIHSGKTVQLELGPWKGCVEDVCVSYYDTDTERESIFP